MTRPIDCYTNRNISEGNGAIVRKIMLKLPFSTNTVRSDSRTLTMQTTSGSIEAHVLGVEHEETQLCPCGQGLPPIVLVMSTDSGSVSITMPGFQERWRPPIHSYATSNAGSIRVTLPESFQGLVKIHKVPGMRIETGLQQLQDGDAKYDVFCVGSGPCDEGSKCEKCDQVVIKSSGGEVKVSYSEDVVLEATMHR